MAAEYQACSDFIRALIVKAQTRDTKRRNIMVDGGILKAVSSRNDDMKSLDLTSLEDLCG